MNAGVYIKTVRHDKAKESEGLNEQRERLTGYARSQGWEWGVYDDDIASAPCKDLGKDA